MWQRFETFSKDATDILWKRLVPADMAYSDYLMAIGMMLMVVGYVPKKLRDEAEEIGESVLNAAMATYTLDIYSRLLTYAGDNALAKDALQRADAQRKAVRKQWTGKWFKRSWLTEELGWVGEDNIWLEPQPWAIIGGASDSEQSKILAQSIDDIVRNPQKNGAMILGRPDKMMEGDDGVGTNAGVWPSINGTLIWALALVDGEMGWDEWKKNTLAYHGDAYPDIWYGIWSGPDTYNSELSTYLGGTVHVGLYETEREKADEKEDGITTGGLLQVSWTDFPVMNMHLHAWPLYDVSKILGIEFNPEGIDIKPTLPKDEYRFTSPLLELVKSRTGFKGRYAPLTAGTWKISVKLNDADMKRISGLSVNGKGVEVVHDEGRIAFSGDSSADSPLEWEINL
ncbi:MAG: hypothetical protein P1Q69_01765 [Candidatus Thorarchaeota archaeon]|nr:hypothetical protein [Candidatus Thorarchaeota archaeon]